MRSTLALARVLALAFATTASGCLGGDHTFPDESDQVRSLHVNAYEATSGAAPRAAVLEVSGLGPDQQERAFQGHVHIAIEKALHPESNVQYEGVKEYDKDVTASDFSSPTVAYWKFTIAGADLPATATYRATATATIESHPHEASALFDYRP